MSDRRYRALGISWVLLLTSLGACYSAQPGPANDSGARALRYIVSQQDQKTGLVRSYPPEQNAYTYDCALCLIAMYSGGQTQAAKVLADALTSLQNTDGSFFESYDVSSRAPLRRARYVGANAWVAYALASYGAIAHDGKAGAAARRCAEWLLTLQDADGALFGGNAPDGSRFPWKSTEHAIDAWFALRRVGGFDGATRKVGQWLFREAWNKREMRFNRGENDPVVALDCQTWGAIWLLFQGEREEALRALSFAAHHLASEGKVGSRTIHGFAAQASAKDVVWLEGTAQVLVAHSYLQTAPAKRLIREVLAVQNPDGSWSHSSKTVDLPEVWHSTMPHVGATAWAYFALRCRKGDSVPFGRVSTVR